VWWDELDKWGVLDDNYLDSPEQWDILAAVLRLAGRVGLDTEFYGLDVRKESCVGRARVHVWSVAVRAAKRSPLGFHIARGWVLPVEALNHASLKAVLENEAITKYVHNQPVDDHAIHNHGVDLVGCTDTLNLARWMWPWLTTAGGFGLKNLMVMKLRRNPVCEYVDVVNDVRTITVTKQKKATKTVCSCGAAGCKKRKPEPDRRHDKSKVEVLTETIEEKQERYQHPLESIVPGHPRWELLVKYAAEDAVAALEAAELMEKQKAPAPFPYGKAEARPAFNQNVCNAIVKMEREGFPVDVPWCTSQAERAAADAEKELVWLHAWYVVNGAVVHGPHRREEVDGIWSSPKQLLAMFDELDFPRSPIWKKGKVKNGESKLDATALKWIGKNCSGARQLVDHLLHLKRIRSGMKYLVKLRDSGGWVNPICGPAGDADDRNGAITGRLGIKGTLEAQQLPTREEVDIYQVRKAIVASVPKAA
jgi:hypothetical protein